jgi:pimeloyl-ACP methyl ester carboxylesterase
MARALADRIKGARYRDMPDLGHFPMSENPALFLEYITPVLDEIAAQT